MNINNLITIEPYIIILIIVKVSPGYSEFTAAAGTTISLPCNTSIWGEELISLVLWYKETSGSGLPIYSVDARNSPLSESKHSVPNSYKKRLFFDVKLKPPVLRISPVLEDDAGDYRCRVDYRKSRTKNFVTKLDVIAPPKEMIITDQAGQRLIGTIGPYDEGSDLKLTCEAEGGNPLPNITWWNGESLLDDTFGLAPHNNMKNEIIITNLSRNHFLLELTCKASNTNLTVPIESSIILDINLKPLDVKISSTVNTLSVGKRTELQCLSSGSRPPAKIAWWKGNEKMTNVRDTISSDGNVTLSTVSFIPIVEDNGKYLFCRADNPSIGFSGLEDGRTLNVQFIPQLSISLGAKIQYNSVREGNDVYLECKVIANPWITGVTWYFEEEPLISKPNEGIIVTNQSLVLQKVRRSQAGRYFCTASNSAGQGHSEDFYLKINFAPVCKPGQKIIYGVARNEIVQITCEVEAEPSNVNFKWSLNASNENVDIRSFITNGSVSIATYRPRNRFAYGALACWAVNDIGVQRDPCIFNIIPTGPPEAVRKCQITNQSTTSLNVECIPGDSGGLKQEFTVEVYNSLRQSLHSNYTSTTKPAFHIPNLLSGTPFTLVLYSSNAKGRSHSVSIPGSTLGEPEKHTGAIPQFGFNPMLGILIGTVGALVLIAIIIVIVIRVKADYYEDDRDDGSKEMDSQQRTNTPKSKPFLCDGLTSGATTNEIESDYIKQGDPLKSKDDISGFDFGCSGYDRVTICLNQEHRGTTECPGICDSNCPSTRYHCYLPTMGYNNQSQEITYSDLQMSTTINDQQVNRMLIQSIQNGAAPIDYTALNFQEMAKQSSANMNIGGGDVEMMNNNGSGMMVGLISETKLPKRGLSIADGASDVEMTMETSTLNSNTILSSPYKEIDNNHTRKQPIVSLGPNEEDKSGPVYV
ncbi:hemicentin-1-like isoform X2 [Panonychus citri]|uniref:hemicentin-1-like isoform X2 n=1 Tax=Panonychus citri TaxID=50023 RepID=UPI0023076CCA|nr:hemicentin-1-like isoform X2 [Panonychus citri]XP_053204230.1 hemicentin-1-like isoform X2 [Panonychus citri]XP_053204231.1 hemicentin-1-like isoform X2 [Panonychus citri]